MAASAIRPDFTQQRFAQRKLALLIVFLLVLSAIANAQKAPMVDVGVVLPQDVITGETVSGSIVVSPNDYAGIPGLHVVNGQIPGVAGSTPANLLSNYSVQIGGVAAGQADHPFSFTVTNELQVRIFKTGNRAEDGWSTTIPLSPKADKAFLFPKTSACHR
jgi:hypothetical protein